MMRPMNYPARDNSYSSFSQQVNLCIKRRIACPLAYSSANARPSHKFGTKYLEHLHDDANPVDSAGRVASR